MFHQLYDNFLIFLHFFSSLVTKKREEKGDTTQVQHTMLPHTTPRNSRPPSPFISGTFSWKPCYPTFISVTPFNQTTTGRLRQSSSLLTAISYSRSHSSSLSKLHVELKKPFVFIFIVTGINHCSAMAILLLWKETVT